MMLKPHMTPAAVLVYCMHGTRIACQVRQHAGGQAGAQRCSCLPQPPAAGQAQQGCALPAGAVGCTGELLPQPPDCKLCILQCMQDHRSLPALLQTALSLTEPP